MIFKKILRNLSIYFERITSRWVVPLNIYDLLNEGDSSMVKILLEEQLKIWGNDPEITYAFTLNDFTNGTD
jgi:hypothetical protein